MRPIRFTIAPLTAADNNIAASQSPGSSALTLTALAAGPIDPQSGTNFSLGLGRILIITSGGNDTGIHFTVVGVDQNGNAVTENVTGASGGAAASTNYFTSVSSITPSGAVASTVKVGIRGTTSSAALITVPLNPYERVGSIVSIDVSGTISYTANQTFGDCNSVAALSTNSYFATPASPTALTAQSASKYTQLTPGVCGLQILIPTYSTGGSITVNIISPSNIDRS